MRLIRTLAPKGGFGIACFIGFVLLFVTVIGPRLRSPKGLLLLLAVVVPLGLMGLLLPPRAYEKWHAIPGEARGVFLGAFSYVFLVTLGNFDELYNFRVWIDFLFLREGAPWSSVHTVAVVGALYAMATQWQGAPAGLPPDEERILSGHRLLSLEEARQALPPVGASGEGGLLWGALELPASFGTQHFCIIGASGSGKSKSIQLLMQRVLPRIRQGTNHRALVYDAKRDIYSTLVGMGIPEDRLLILNPFDERCAAWDMAADVRDPATAAEIAAILAPEEKGRDHPFFPEAAQSLIGGVMESFIYHAPGRWTFRDVVLTLRTDSRLKAVLGICPQTRHLVEKFLPGTDTQYDIAATIENTMRRLAFVAAAWDRAKTTFSLQEWVKGDTILLLGSNPSLQSTVQQLNLALFHRVVELVLTLPDASRQKPPGQTWFFIDELRRAGKLPQLPELMVEGRSRGVCVCVGFQDLPGLQEVYGRNLADEIVGACRNKAYLKSTDAPTAAYASEFFGNQEVEITRYSPSWSTSETEGESRRTHTSGFSIQRSLHTRPVIPPAAFRQIKEANPVNGLGGYYYLAEIGEPHFAVLPGTFVSEQLSAPSPSILDLEPRPSSHQTLRDWDAADLDRLRLKAQAAQLLDPAAPAPIVPQASVPSTPEAEAPLVLPKRRV